MRHSSLIAGTCAGFASAVGQIAILRELLVLFHGNELSTGLIFFCWLLWTALGAGLARRAGQAFAAASLPLVLAVLALGLPASVLLARVSRFLWAVPAGQQIHPAVMLGMVLSTTAVFCLASGAAFSLAWRAASSEEAQGSERPLSVYLGEAAGAGFGGLFFYFLLLPHFTTLQAATLTASIVLCVVSVQLHSRAPEPGRSPVSWKIPALVIILAAAVFTGPTKLEDWSRFRQWGTAPVAVRDTPFHNLAVLKAKNQFSLFSNGLWLFSVPDPQNAEGAVHLALLQHPNPRSVLLVGGAAAGLTGEILKHPGIREVDCVEPDPEIIRLAEAVFPASVTASLKDPRVRIHHEDARSFIRHAPRRYDAVLLCLGEPTNADLNGFYTMEFFANANRLVEPHGILSLAVPSAPDIIGPAQARLLRSIHTTLKTVFPAVLLVPGESARFFAAHSPSDLVSDPQALADRISERKLDLRYVREYFLFDLLSPLRLEYALKVLESAGPEKPNRDFEPTCYFNGLLLWGAQLHPSIEQMLLRFAKAGSPAPWIVLAAVILFALFRGGFAGRGAAVTLNTALTGGVQMVLEIVLLLGFQMLEGFVYAQLATIVSAYMAGLALGAGLHHRLRSLTKNPVKSLALIQGALALYCFGTLELLLALHGHIQSGRPATISPSWIFSALALAAGVLGGLHFSLAVKAVASSAPGSPRGSGARLYAWDTAGAAAGALVGSIFLLPVYGLSGTLGTLSLLSLGGILALAGKPRGKLTP